MRDLHHRFEDLPIDHPMEGIVRRRLIGEHAMLSHVTLAAGTFVPSHHHANEQMAIVLEGRLRFVLGDPDGPDAETVEVGAGGVLHLPPNLPHSAEILEDAVVLDVFSPPSETTGIDTGPSDE